MKILAVADMESRYFYDYYTPGKLQDYDLIISCGDLRANYLEFLVTMARCPLLYVHGNHDEGYDKNPPEGCVCIDGRIVNVDGVRILGLGGSHRYRDGKYMYTEGQMRGRIRRLALPLMRNGGFDILVTHAPARHVNDFDSEAHKGFACFNELLARYEPTFFLHGHIHMNYGVKIPRTTQAGRTTVVNAFEHYAFDFTAS